MLIIRDAQMAILGNARVDSFVQQMVDSLSNEYPVSAAAGPEAMTALVRNAIEGAAARGLRSEGAIAIWTELTLVFGKDLALSPDRTWAKRILAHPDLPDFIKMDIVRERLTARTAGRVLVRAADTR